MIRSPSSLGLRLAVLLGAIVYWSAGCQQDVQFLLPDDLDLEPISSGQYSSDPAGSIKYAVYGSSAPMASILSGSAEVLRSKGWEVDGPKEIGNTGPLVLAERGAQCLIYADFEATDAFASNAKALIAEVDSKLAEGPRGYASVLLVEEFLCP